MKFGRPMQKVMLMTKIRPKSKPEIEFQYGGRLFSETGSSFIYPLRCLIEIWYASRLPKQVPSLKLNLEIDFQPHGRHLEKSI